MSEEITLHNLIRNAKHDVEGSPSHLTDNQKEYLVDLIGKGCRYNTKERLYRRANVPLACWPNYGIFDRVEFTEEYASYCAGQSYPDEIRTVRELILKG